ncbi:diguanylate cyclase [Mycobacterium sp. smrl_JER01]|uniref:GGDEF domain-containing protein n=1 Tax=Mycobacterium sp. smrl_JER01 TaxID=3402633 RepID=UPI003AC97993
MSEWWWRRWGRSDHFDWFSAYLRDRGLQTPWRWGTFAFTVFVGAVPVMTLASPEGPSGAGTGVAVAASVAGFMASTLWLFRWPTRSQSLVYAGICTACIAVGCLVMPNPYGGLMGCTVFAAIGGFLAYFHAFAHVLLNFAFAAACAAVSAARMFGETGDLAIVTASALIVLGLNLGVPFGVHSLVHTLHTDLRNSDRDPLTGLLNRRSFYNSVYDLLSARRQINTNINVTMVDLDDFKGLNDSRGHAAGDAALVDVAAVLQRSGAGSVLARLGGEEFVVADADTASGHALTAERIRQGIAATPFEITASLGICTATVAAGVEVEHPQFIERLIREADAAMYAAKRAGGDRVLHRYLDQGGSGRR